MINRAHEMVGQTITSQGTLFSLPWAPDTNREENEPGLVCNVSGAAEALLEIWDHEERVSTVPLEEGVVLSVECEELYIECDSQDRLFAFITAHGIQIKLNDLLEREHALSESLDATRKILSAYSGVDQAVGS